MPATARRHRSKATSLPPPRPPTPDSLRTDRPQAGTAEPSRAGDPSSSEPDRPANQRTPCNRVEHSAPRSSPPCMRAQSYCPCCLHRDLAHLKHDLFGAGLTSSPHVRPSAPPLIRQVNQVPFPVDRVDLLVYFSSRLSQYIVRKPTSPRRGSIIFRTKHESSCCSTTFER